LKHELPTTTAATDAATAASTTATTATASIATADTSIAAVHRQLWRVRQVFQRCNTGGALDLFQLLLHGGGGGGIITIVTITFAISPVTDSSFFFELSIGFVDGGAIHTSPQPA
jgi:hypothetical protein